MNAAFSGREGQVRDLLTRLDTFAGTFDDQRDNIVSTIVALDRFSGRLAAKDDVITEALRKVPPALEVLERERPRITTALEKLGTFSDLATRLVHDAGGDLVKNFQNLDPTIRALADVGPELDDESAITGRHLPFETRQRIFFMRVGMQEHGKVPAHFAKLSAQQLVAAAADDDPVAFLDGQPEQGVPDGTANQIHLHG